MLPPPHPHSAHPRVGVWSRRIVKGFAWGAVAEAFESGSIVVMDDVVKEGVTFGVAVELVLAAVSGGGLVGVDGVGEASVEAFDEAVGLRPVG